MPNELSEIRLPRGRYILAVSGGVDSMALMDLVASQDGLELVVAHFDHGMRPDSSLDKQLVERVVKERGLRAEFAEGKLGPGASEAQAREARYRFLNKVKEKHSARAIVTAHHQDDLVETAFLNLLRGSGRRGLSAIGDSDVIRPLLAVTKSQIIKYARQKGLAWREDSSNSESKYLRNYLRKGAMSRLTAQQRQAIVSNIGDIARTNVELNREIATLSQIIGPKNVISRAKFINLPAEIADELIMHWLRQLDMRQFDRKMVQRLSLSIKTARPGTRQALKKHLWLEIGPKSAHFTTTD